MAGQWARASGESDDVEDLILEARSFSDRSQLSAAN
jgi:hypothetical protein